MRKHLTYANVTSTLALVIALGAGSAYAVDQIGSGDIRNNSIVSDDLRDKRGVAGSDVIRDSFGRREVDERSLVGGRLLPVRGGTRGACDLSTPGFTECVATTLRLPRRGRILAVATGAFHGDDSGPTSARCELRVDGGGDPIGQSPGEVIGGDTTTTATDGFARTLVFGPLDPGIHEVALVCDEILGEATIDTPTISAVGVTGR